jgi:seryl-tRNA synthetase
VTRKTMTGTGQLPKFEEDSFKTREALAEDERFLIPTAEVPVTNYHADEILEPGVVPVQYCAWTPCFRREAGSYGKDTKGIIRVHWFDKVEMFSFAHPADAEAEHQRLLAWEAEFLDKLEVAYRVIDVAAGDLGLSAERKFDCEAWIPTQGRYRELTSTSNCTDFQARRLDIRGRFEDGVRHLATLNGTLCAIPRTVVALLETHQREDGSVRVPAAMRPYLQGRDILEPALA